MPEDTSDTVDDPFTQTDQEEEEERQRDAFFIECHADWAFETYMDCPT
jgi:hypothetical protein